MRCAMRCLAWTAVLFLILGVGAELSVADGHHRERRRERAEGSRYWTPQSPDYENACGQCHLAYPPVLLPGRSWSALLAGSADHFGGDLGLEPGLKEKLAGYLTPYAADGASGGLGRKIMRDIGGDTPLRITEVPYIIHKHQDDDIPADAFTRKSVGSLANCGACHPGAARGCFDDDQVRIPPR